MTLPSLREHIPELKNYRIGSGTYDLDDIHDVLNQIDINTSV